MNIDLWKDCNNIILWGVERVLAYNLLDALQHQNIYALVPNKELKQALKKRLEEQGSDANLNIEQAYLNDKEGEATLREFSLPQMNSIKAPSGILDIYPGLKQLQLQSVTCLSPNSLLKAYELSDQVNNTLWLEVNGQITSTIQGLIKSQKIYLFTRILIFMPKQAWYEPELDAEELIQSLKQVGYDISNKNDDLDIDQGLYEFTRHPLVLEKKALGCELERLNQALEKSQYTNIELARQKSDEYIKIVSELQVKIDEATQARDTQAKAVEEQKAQIQQLTTAIEQQEKLEPELIFFRESLEHRIEELSNEKGLIVELININYNLRGYWFYFLKNDYIPKRIVEANKFYEIDFLLLLAQFYEDGSVIIDGGANIGNHSLFFAGELKAKVIAFEPQPYNFIILNANVDINRLASFIEVKKLAIGDRVGEIEIALSIESNYGTFTANKEVVLNKKDGDTNSVFVVPLTTLDKEIKEKNISIIKLDIEGMELEALKGAVNVLINSRPLVAVECFNKSVFDNVNDFLCGFGYFVFESVNATPTFVFLCKNNDRHISILNDYLRKSCLAKFSNKKSFIKI